mmetsp:Transcript_31243/g.79029  ORF Transcript_31243/g.79029 Transcript_31243/m.79029 type:complete len:84 (+) Transcript_31243:297-548(+)
MGTCYSTMRRNAELNAIVVHRLLLVAGIRGGLQGLTESTLFSGQKWSSEVPRAARRFCLLHQHGSENTRAQSAFELNDEGLEF